MLRVISGKYRSRQLKEVKSTSTRPTTDKNKEVLFNTLGQYFDGGRMLDLFSGSGAIAIEAYSRGFTRCDLVENGTEAFKTIRDNLSCLKIPFEDMTVFKKDVFAYLAQTTEKYDLIVADPPYKLNRYEEMIDLITSRQLLNDGGIMVLESDNTYELNEEFPDLRKYKEKILGNSKFTFYIKEKT